MSDWETALVSKTCQNGGTETLLAHGVESKHFSDDKNREVWNFVTEHIAKYKAHPSFDLIREQFPEYKWEVVTDPLEVVQDKFIVEVKRTNGIQAFRKLAKVFTDNDTEKMAHIDELFLDEAKKLAEVVPSSHISRFSQMPSRIQMYRERKAEGLQIGIPFGIPRLDEWTLGLYPHEYVTIAGWTGVGKSTLALVLAINHYVEGYTPLFISLEMGADELYRKLDSISVGIRQHSMKAMNLTSKEMEKWEEFAEKVESAKNDIIIVDVNNATTHKIYAETSRWNPDVVFVDYVQLLRSVKPYKNMWEKVAENSENLKRMARQLQIPVYGLAQSGADSSDEGAKLKNLAGSKDIGKHSDIMIGLYQDEIMREANRMEVRVEKNRGGQLGKFDLYWNQNKCVFRQWQYGDEFEEKQIVD